MPMSPHNVRSFNHSLAIAAAAMLIHIGAADAADPAAHIQAQMTGSVTGTTKPLYGEHVGPSERKGVYRAPDAQELARRLLLGGNGYSTSHAPTIKTEVIGTT